MAITGLEKIVGEHPLFAGLGEDFLAAVTGCARNKRVSAGAYLFHEGESADHFFLVREGTVALEICVPGQGQMTLQTVGKTGVVGLSWLVPPYRWSFDARAVEDLRVLEFDAICLRRKCEGAPALGYEVMKRFMPVLVDRIHHARLQILDVYGARG